MEPDLTSLFREGVRRQETVGERVQGTGFRRRIPNVQHPICNAQVQTWAVDVDAMRKACHVRECIEHFGALPQSGSQ
jgi:hypothetical protein